LCRRREKREKRDITKVNDHQKNMLIRIYIWFYFMLVFFYNNSYKNTFFFTIHVNYN
jgi:hypothetical protein